MPVCAHSFFFLPWIYQAKPVRVVSVKQAREDTETCGTAAGELVLVSFHVWTHKLCFVLRRMTEQKKIYINTLTV